MNYTYAGPVIVAKFKFVEKQSTINGCSNPSCRRKSRQNGKFCSNCGHTIEQVTSTPYRVQFPNMQDLMDAGLEEDAIELNDNLEIDPNIHDSDYWTPNKKRGQPRSFLICPNDIVNFKDIDPVSEKAWLEKEFAPELVILRNLYASAEIQWLIMVYNA